MRIWKKRQEDSSVAGRAAAILLASLFVLSMVAGAADERAVKSRVAPVYPEIAKRMKIGGAVKLEVTVDADGKVADVKPVSGNQMLSIAAQDAVRKWRFVPGPGESTVSVEIEFNVAQ